jgi:hypothetical protein
MKLKPRFSLTALLLLFAVVACLISASLWLRTNVIIRSGIPGTLVARNGVRYPTNRWFRMPIYDSWMFEAHTGQTNAGVFDPPRIEGMNDYPILETKNGKFLAIVSLWSYKGSGNDDFRVELLVHPENRIEQQP